MFNYWFNAPEVLRDCYENENLVHAALQMLRRSTKNTDTWPMWPGQRLTYSGGTSPSTALISELKTTTTLAHLKRSIETIYWILLHGASEIHSCLSQVPKTPPAAAPRPEQGPPLLSAWPEASWAPDACLCLPHVPPRLLVKQTGFVRTHGWGCSA